jgi:5-methyltetrahydropteroyltriglutamate--homocysteine methyltransferase
MGTARTRSARKACRGWRMKAPRGLGAVEEFKRLQRLAAMATAHYEKPPTLKASVPGPYTLSGRLLPSDRYGDRYALTEALLPLVPKRTRRARRSGLPRDHRR